MPATVVTGERVDLGDHDGLVASEDFGGIDPFGHQHRFQRFWGGEQYVGPLAFDSLPDGGADIAVPYHGASSHPLRVLAYPRCEIVQQRFEWADVENRDSVPAL